MSLINWSGNYSVGVDAVDAEHRGLIESINSLHALIGAGAGHDRVLESLGKIYAAIAAHFADEEQTMRSTNFPGLAEHKQDHDTLLADLRDIIEEIEDDGSFDELQLASDFERWFGDHFRTFDVKLHRFPRR